MIKIIAYTLILEFKKYNLIIYMIDNLVNETLYSDNSKLIPNNIKFYIIKLSNFENSDYYRILDQKAYSSKNICDNKFEKKKFYETMFIDVNNSYLPILNKYPILKSNYDNIINYLKKKI